MDGIGTSAAPLYDELQAALFRGVAVIFSRGVEKGKMPRIQQNPANMHIKKKLIKLNELFKTENGIGKLSS